MNVLESRAGRALRRRPWVLLVGAVVVIAAVFFITRNSAAPGHSGSSPAAGASHSTSDATSASTAFRLRSTTPAAGAQDVAPDSTISVTFSAPVSVGTPTPVLAPPVAGKWVQTSATTLTYELDSPLIPSSQEVLTIPGGSHGLRASDGSVLPTSSSVAFGVAPGDTLRLQQLLAQLNFLPVAFVTAGPPPSRVDLAQDQPGTFSWRWPGLP